MIPEYCVHRRSLPGVTHEKATQGMKVIYAGSEIGVIQQVFARTAFVLFLGDRTAKSVRLEDLTYWEGP